MNQARLDSILSERCGVAYHKSTCERKGVSFHVTKVYGTTVIAIRGTDEKRDWWRDVRLYPKGAGDYYFHSGFWKGAEAIMHEVITQVICDSFKRPVIITGHSMGAGIGLCLARMLVKRGYHVEAFVGFGMPRSMSRIKRKDIGFPVRHYKLGKDIVPSLLPLGLFYRHVSPAIKLGGGCRSWWPNWSDHSIKWYRAQLVKRNLNG